MRVRVIANWKIYDLDEKILKHKKERGGIFDLEDVEDEKIRAELQPLVDFNFKLYGCKHLWYSYISNLANLSEEKKDAS